MGVMNLLKASWSGRVGQTVGSKWKDKNTIRTYSKPAYTDTPVQHEIRTGFGLQTSFVALFADQIKSLSALDTKSMSVRNAILRLNKGQIVSGDFDPALLLVNRGGLPAPTDMAITVQTSNVGLHAEWTPAVGATISQKAKVVVIAVNQDESFAAVGAALNKDAELTIAATVPASVPLHCYYYLLDYRGSTKVGSLSHYIEVTQ